MNNPVSQLRGMDLVKWLDNKLGDPNELWSGRQASSVLSREILNELSTCFQALEPHVKLKIIEAIPHLSPKLIQMWRDPLVNLLDIAKDDPDNWIRTIAKMYITYPTSGSIKCDIIDTDKQYADTVNDFQKILDESIPKLEINVIPPDSLIVTPTATQMSYGYSNAEPKKHFTLRKPSKSERMLQDALKQAQQSAHAPTKKFGPGVTSSLPIRVRSTIRKPDNTLPMRGIPAAPVSKISSGFSNEPKKFQRNITKREGGAVLIDISDLPQAPIVKKRRGPALPRPAPAAETKATEPKKRAAGGGRKPKNAPSNNQQNDQHANETAATESSGENAATTADQHEQQQQEGDSVTAHQIPNPPTPQVMGPLSSAGVSFGGTFSFI